MADEEQTGQKPEEATPKSGEDTSQDFVAYQAERRAKPKNEESPAQTGDPKSPEEAQPTSESAGDPEREAGGQESKAESKAETKSPDGSDATGEKPKRKGGFQRKIETLESDVALKDATIAELLARLAGTEKEPPPKTQPAPQESAAEKPKRPIEENFDTDEAYEAAMEKYLDDVMEWKLDKREKAAAAKAAEEQAVAKQNEIVEAHKQREIAYRQQHDDYDEARQVLVNEGVPDHIAAGITESPASAEIVHHLGKNIAEYRELVAKDAISAIRHLGILEARFTAKTGPLEGYTQPDKPIEKVPSGAPPPTLDGSESFDVYQQKRKAQARAS
jgi:hypothetical protein